jgi:hypothetical protein
MALERAFESRRSGEFTTAGSPSYVMWLGWAARVGYASYGLVYIAVGAIAAAVATGAAERTGDAQRAMLILVRQPLGEVAVVALGVGFLGYAALNLSGAFRDPEQRGRSLAGVLTRAADALTGALYVSLAVVAVRIAAAPSREGDDLTVTWAAGVLSLPFGSAILHGIGLALAAAGGFLIYRARAEPFHDVLDRRLLSVRTRGALTAAARFGTLARGMILALCGLFVIEAAMTRRAERVGGIGEALSAMDTTVFGSWLLGVAALGFIGYGVYQLAKVRYRRVPIR